MNRRQSSEDKISEDAKKKREKEREREKLEKERWIFYAPSVKAIYFADVAWQSCLTEKTNN